MSDHALTRKVRVCGLKKGETVPCDGRIYRDSEGNFFIGLRYAAEKEKYHAWLLRAIDVHEKGRAK